MRRSGVISVLLKLVLLMLPLFLVVPVIFFIIPRFAPTLLHPPGDPSLYKTMIEEAASRHSVSPDLVRAVIRQESEFRPRMIGGVGELGLMQITPNAARDWYRAHGREYRFRGLLLDPRLNIEIGTWYLARGLRYWEEYSDADVLALAEYNAGRRRVRQWAPDDPRENAIDSVGFSSTKAYIIRILGYRDLYAQESGKSH